MAPIIARYRRLAPTGGPRGPGTDAPPVRPGAGSALPACDQVRLAGAQRPVTASLRPGTRFGAGGYPAHRGVYRAQHQRHDLASPLTATGEGWSVDVRLPEPG